MLRRWWYLSFKLVELGNVVEYGRNDADEEEKFLPWEVFKRVNDGEVPLDSDGHCNKNGAHPANVTEPEANRHDVDVDLAGVLGRDGRQPEDEDGNEKVSSST